MSTQAFIGGNPETSTDRAPACARNKPERLSPSPPIPSCGIVRRDTVLRNSMSAVRTEVPIPKSPVYPHELCVLKLVDRPTAKMTQSKCVGRTKTIPQSAQRDAQETQGDCSACRGGEYDQCPACHRSWRRSPLE